MIIELNNTEAALVAGGLTVAELEQRYPNGEWIGSSFYPNGFPRIPNDIDPSI